jgi:quercetin dioxygenase-like cupin family protein
MMTIVRTAMLAAGFLLIGGPSPLFAQAEQVPAEAVQRIPLQQQNFPDPTFTTNLLEVRIAPGAEVAPHAHPGIEIGYVLSGEGEFTIPGQGKRVLEAGGSYSVSPQAVHSVKNVGTETLVLVATLVVERGKPLSKPAG